MDEVKRLTNQLITLLDDRDFRSELKTFKSAYQRLRVRLRNNQLVAHLKTLITSTRQLQEKFPSSILGTYVNQLNDDEKKAKRGIKSLREHVIGMVEFLETTLGQTLYVYGYTQPHFRVGHLIHHLIIIRACISRFRIYLKALLVYSCDLCVEIDSLNLLDTKSPKDHFDQILCRHDCKPRNLSAVIAISPPVQKTDDQTEIGQLIDRDTMQIKTESRSKRTKLR